MKLKSFFTNFTKLFDNSRGFSIAEVMVAAGLMGVVSLGVMEISKQQTRVQKKANIDLDINQVIYEIQDAMRDPNSCIKTLMAGGATPTAASKYSTPKVITQVVRLKRDGVNVIRTYDVESRLPTGSTGNYGFGQGAIRIKDLKFRPENKNSDSTTNTVTAEVQNFQLLVTFGVKTKGAPASAPGYAFDTTAGFLNETVVTKVITFQAQANAGWQVLNCVGDDDVTKMWDAQCDLFQGTVQADASGNRRCKRITVGFDTGSGNEKSLQVLGDFHSKTASITNTLLVNPTKSGSSGFLDITTGDSTVDLGPNLRVSGAAISATAATAVSLGTSVADTTLSVGTAKGVINAGTGGNGVLNLGSTVGTLNLATGGAGTINIGTGAAGKANVNGQLSWGNSSSTGLLSSDGNGAIELGPQSGGGSPTPFIDFHSDGAATDYNARIINIAGGLQLVAGSATYLTLTDTANVDSTLSGNQLIIPTADYTYGSNMGRAVNKDWVYNVLTGAVANTFFDAARSDAIIGHILNSASAQTNYGILRDNILDYQYSARYMGVSGALRADLGTNKQYWGTHCPTGYQVRATALDTTVSPKKYFVECAPDCTNSAAPCANVYVSTSLNVTGQICLNGICKTSWGGVDCGIGRFMYGLSAKGYPMCRSIGFEP